ncbi:MAG: PAS domain S-box protein [Candidatus Acidiferrum sp.]
MTYFFDMAEMPGEFYPHGFCYQWDKGLVWLNVLSDGLIAISYFAIPIILFWFIRKRRDLPFSWMFGLFGLFIVACGATHVLEVWNLWHAQYWVAGIVKAITAAASVPTAIVFAKIVPQALEMPSNREWIQANAKLQAEMQERKDLELDVRVSEARFRDTVELLDLTHDAILARNLAGQVIYWNRGAERLYGWQKEEVHGKNLRDLLSTEASCSIEEIEKQVLQDGYWEGELTHRRRDESKIVVSSRWALRTDVMGNPNAILETNRDITKKREEEGKFRNLLEAAPDAMVIVNRLGSIELVNTEAEKLFGYPRQEILGQPVEILIPRRFHEIHMMRRHDFVGTPHIRTLIESPSVVGRHKNGTEFPVEISLCPIETADGYLVSSVIRDISKRKEFEEQLRQQEEKFRVLVSGVKGYAIFMLDPGGNVISWNVGAQHIKGYTDTEIIGKHFSIFYTAQDRAAGKPQRELQLATEDGRAEDEGWRVRKDGTRFWANIVITALYESDGKLRGFGKVTRDITERKKAQEKLAEQTVELAKSNADLLEVNKELEAFSYSVSHDLRAPLRSIDGFSHALLEDCSDRLDAIGKDHLSRVRAATQRMGILIDDLLALSRISRSELHLETVNISALTHEILTNLERTQPGRKIELIMDEGLAVEADEKLLRIGMENLLNNAWKFTSRCPIAHITVGKEGWNGTPVYYVRDDGAGFDPAYADHLFGAFQRLHTEAEFPGTGVGLATVQRIIRKHGGQIWAKGAVNQGATFYFTLNGHPGDAH